MIEMRWLVPVEGEKRLQYRQMMDTTIYANAATNALSREWINTGNRNMEWSEWRDVPLVAERDPSYP
jgi:hypothetical protein